MNISDPRVPLAVQQYGRCLRPPARVVIPLGEGHYLLAAANGEALDLLKLKESEKLLKVVK